MKDTYMNTLKYEYVMYTFTGIIVTIVYNLKMQAVNCYCRWLLYQSTINYDLQLIILNTKLIVVLVIT